MIRIFAFSITIFGLINMANAGTQDSVTYKKRVLEATEIDLLMSYYEQDGDHSAVTGGIGSEKLTDVASAIVINIPLNDDDVLTIDAGISAYSSASSSNVNPFTTTGASGFTVTGTPWSASTGASKNDELISLLVKYSHSSDDRNTILSGNIYYSHEYDYSSFGIEGGIKKLFNKKNTELTLNAQVYIDDVKEIYPTELNEYLTYGDDFQQNGHFYGVRIRDQNRRTSYDYKPGLFEALTSTGRNSYSLSFVLSQILNKRIQLSLLADVIYQDGLLSSTYNRIYFADKENYYIGNGFDIPRYTSRENQGAFHLADDIERLPSTRLKIPIATRVNFFINELFVLRTYYRYYSDDWNIDAHTAQIELPVKVHPSVTVTPIYRYYTQTAADYFGAYDTHTSTRKYYTSDYDLSDFSSNQYGLGITYTDIFTKLKLGSIGLKAFNVRYNHYDRNDGLNADIVSFGLSFVVD